MKTYKYIWKCFRTNALFGEMTNIPLEVWDAYSPEFVNLVIKNVEGSTAKKGASWGVLSAWFDYVRQSKQDTITVPNFGPLMKKVNERSERNRSHIDDVTDPDSFVEKLKGMKTLKTCDILLSEDISLGSYNTPNSKKEPVIVSESDAVRSIDNFMKEVDKYDSFEDFDSDNDPDSDSEPV
jgi:hypothetical protein